MLMLIEHDSILSTPEARRSLAAFVANRPNMGAFQKPENKAR